MILRDISGDILQLQIDIDSLNKGTKQLNEKINSGDQVMSGVQFRLTLVEDRLKIAGPSGGYP